MPRDRRSFYILPLAALVAIAPLILRGCSCGHDFDFHVINWFEVARQLTHGTFLPHWAFTPAWNAGEPRFVFYPPLSWLIGSTLGLLMPWSWTPIAYTWLALTAAGFALHHAVHEYASPNAALVAAAIYLTNPYILYTAYERSADAELLAAAWLPLALHAVLRRRVTIPAVAIPVALLWLTNAPAAVMGCYAMATIVLIRLALPHNQTQIGLSRTRLAANSAVGALLGLGLSAFYLLPAAYERRFVQIDFAILPGLRPWDNFLFQHTADPEHDAVLVTASIVALILTALTVLALLWIYVSPTKPDPQPDSSERRAITPDFRISLLALTVVIFFMLMPLSAPLWLHLPELRFLQFPWRLLAILGTVFGFALALAFSRLRFKASLVAIFCAAVFALPSYYAFHEYCYPEDTVPERLAIFRSADPGSDPTDEYTPIGADNDTLNQSNPGYWLAESSGVSAPSGSIAAPAPLHLDLSPTAPTTLILNLRNYPAWQITRNGSLVPTRLPRKDGLIAIPLPAGSAHIEISYATLPDQKFGYLLAALSAIVWIALILHDRDTTQSS